MIGGFTRFVADPGCLCRILIFFPFRFLDLGSNNSNKKGGGKFVTYLFFEQTQKKYLSQLTKNKYFFL